MTPALYQLPSRACHTCIAVRGHAARVMRMRTRKNEKARGRAQAKKLQDVLTRKYYAKRCRVEAVHGKRGEYLLVTFLGDVGLDSSVELPGRFHRMDVRYKLSKRN